ncbi:MAG TPA: signal peptidase I [Candidatus Angelobacter sp.]
MPAKTKTEEKTEKQRQKETMPESIQGIASVLVAGLFIITFIVQAFEIPSSSMENTLLIGDHVFVDRLTPSARAAYVGPLVPYRPVRRGEIIVFLHPKQSGLYVVKRIMGVPGDRIHLRDGKLFINGVAQDEPYLNPVRFSIAYADNFPLLSPIGVQDIAAEWPMMMHENIQGDDLVVPPGNYFGMGDNRSRSLDSRYWGFIPQENIVGRPTFIYWSFITPERQYERTSMGERLGFVFHIITHFFSETRWSRMFHRVH